MNFDVRLQPAQLGLGTSVMNQSLLKLTYACGTTENSVNVKSQQISFQGLAQPFVQTYSYDSLNRLKSAVETQNGTQVWRQTFTFDCYGNRNFDEPNTTTLPKNCGVPQNPTICPEDVARLNSAINPQNNRLSSPGWQYDNAGNTKTDANGQIFIYDGENKQVEVRTDSSVVVGQYFYNGDGQRIKKIVPSTGETTIFVYDASNKLVAEYSTIVEPQSTAKLSYLTQDHLGSPRILTDQNGAVISRRDFLPFGEEIASGTGGRTSGQGYVGADSIRQKFTGYERDHEANLDFAKARMYSSNLGRFTSVDPLLIEKRHIVEPQSLNRYLYVTNNPYAYIDSTGLEKIKIIIRTFIPQPTVSAPGVKVVGLRPPKLLPTKRTFQGDNRDVGQDGSNRTEQVIVIETDKRRNNGDPYYAGDSRVGETREIDARGNVINRATADASGLTTNVTRNGETVNIAVTGEVSNPLIASPAISYDFNIGIQSQGPDGNANISIQGSHDGFPAYEIYVVRPETGSSEAKLVYAHDPRKTSQTVASLAPPKEFSVDTNVTCDPTRVCKPK